MADGDCIAQLGGWAGYRVLSWRHEARGARRWLVLDLAPDGSHERICSGCDGPVAAVHDRTLRRIRDLPVFEAPVELPVVRLRLACPRCGPRLEKLDWLAPRSRVTRRLAQSVARFCTVASVRHAARWHGLDWKTAKAIDFRELERAVEGFDEGVVCRLARSAEVELHTMVMRPEIHHPPVNSLPLSTKTRDGAP